MHMALYSKPALTVNSQLSFLGQLIPCRHEPQKMLGLLPDSSANDKGHAVLQENGMIGSSSFVAKPHLSIVGAGDWLISVHAWVSSTCLFIWVHKRAQRPATSAGVNNALPVCVPVAGYLLICLTHLTSCAGK